MQITYDKDTTIKLSLAMNGNKKLPPCMQSGSSVWNISVVYFTRNQSMVRPKRPRLSSEPRTLSTSPSTFMEQL